MLSVCSRHCGSILILMIASSCHRHRCIVATHVVTVRLKVETRIEDGAYSMGGEGGWGVLVGGYGSHPQTLPNRDTREDRLD